MKNLLLLLLFLTCTVSSYAQTTDRRGGIVEVTFTKEKKPKKIFIKAKIKAPFPGGDSAWIQSLEQKLNKTIVYKNGAKPGKYVVSIGFIIDKEGYLSELVCINKPVGYGMEENVMHAIKVQTKSQKWHPSQQQGRKVQPLRTSSVTPPIDN